MSTHAVNPFTIVTQQLPVDRIIDRWPELERIEQALARSESVLVVGENGIGKTSMLRKLRHQLAQRADRKPLLVELDVPSLNRGAAAFLPSVVEHLIDTIGTDVIGLPATARFSSIVRSPRISGSDKKALLEHFREYLSLTRQKSLTETESRTNEFSGAMVFGGKSGETKAVTQTSDGLQPHDFLDMASELMSMLDQRGIDRAIVFGDEANHLTPESELDLIQYNLEAFVKRRIQFVLTMRRDVFDRNQGLRQVFPTVAELGPFVDLAHIEQLLEQYSLCEECADIHVAFPPSAARKIQRITGGNPRQIQMFCQKLWQKGFDAGRPIGPDDLDNVMFELYTLTPR